MLGLTHFLDKSRTDPLVRNTAIYWVASLVVSAINYLYYPILGRIMHPANFGEVQTIISIFTQAAVFIQVLSLVGIGIIARYKTDSERKAVSDELSRLALWLSLVILGLTVMFSVPLARFFQFSSISPFLFLAGALVISVPLSFANSYLQGHERFWALSIGNLMGSVAKIGFSVAFIAMGFATDGAIGGLVCAQILGLIYALRVGRGVKEFVKAHLAVRLPRFDLIGSELGFAGIVLVTSFATNLMLSFDILVVKHYFPPTQAGYYAGISTISNIIFFLTTPMAGALIPALRPDGPSKRNRALLRRSLWLVLAIGGCATLIFIIAPTFVVTALLGARFGAYAIYLRGLSLALFMMSIVNLLVYYQIGLRNYLIAPIVGAGLIATLALLASSHATMGMVVVDLVYGAAISLALLVGLTVFSRREAA